METFDDKLVDFLEHAGWPESCRDELLHEIKVSQLLTSEGALRVLHVAHAAHVELDEKLSWQGYE